MGEINLTDIKKDTFGSRFPNIFIEQITVDYYEGVLDSEESASINANLNIKFTKPAHIQHGSVENFITNYLSDLYLYVYLTYKTAVKEQLENDNFSLLHWMKFQSDYIPEDYKAQNHYKIY